MGILPNPLSRGVGHDKITHALRIPLATAKSSPQLQRSLDKIRRDDLTRALPNPAWSQVGSLCLHIGSLSLPNQSRLTTAQGTLKNFDVASSLGDRAQPLSVTLRGLHSGLVGEQRELTNRLYANVAFTDDTGLASLRRLTADLRAAFGAEGLLVTKNYKDPSELSMRLMSTMYLKSDEPKRKPTSSSYNFLRSPLFDARDTYAAYKDTAWAEDFALERICISVSSLADMTKRGTVIGQGYQHVFCIPFPGFETTSNLEDPDIEYVPAPKISIANKIRTPLVIPSNSQPIAPRVVFVSNGRR